MEKVYVAFYADKDKVDLFKKYCSEQGSNMSNVLRGFLYKEVRYSPDILNPLSRAALGKTDR